MDGIERSVRRQMLEHVSPQGGPFFINTSEKFYNDEVIDAAVDKFSAHAWWDSGQCWKNILNNFRLVIQQEGVF